MSAENQRAALIVEDEPIIRLVAAESLADEGLVTYEAADAVEALITLARHPEIAVLFTDINMPGDIDGLALASRAYQIRPDIEIIVTSGRERLRSASLPDLAPPTQ
jgi:CheY-like chemotaxis protein